MQVCQTVSEGKDSATVQETFMTFSFVCVDGGERGGGGG